MTGYLVIKIMTRMHAIPNCRFAFEVSRFLLFSETAVTTNENISKIQSHDAS
jgi:hypothetical protein